MVAGWRSKLNNDHLQPIGSSSPSPTTSTSEIPTAPILPTPPTIVAPSTNIISPIVAPPGVHRRRAWTVRKMVGPLPSHRLALRYTSHHLDRSTLGSSSDHSSSNRCRSFLIWAFYFRSDFIWAYFTSYHHC
ncbi:hypothetical protein Tco_1429867 [Tanacetum coccineum]